MSDTKVAPNIWRTATGWRVFVRIPDPVTGKSTLAPKRFKDDGRPDAEQLADLAHFRDVAKLDAKQQRRHARVTRPAVAIAAATFAQDATRYLALDTVKAMPSYATREIEIAKWVTLIGPRVRRTVTTQQIDEHLQQLRNSGYAGSTVNKFRTALMALWTRLDGRSAANPVRDTRTFEESALIARGQPQALLRRILDALPAGWPCRPRLEVMAATGMEPKQVGELTPDDISLVDRWYITQRDKGRRRRTPRPLIRKPMSDDARAAFQRFVDANVWGPFDARSLRRTWLRACARVQAALREEYGDPTFTVPHIRLKDIRHSFGTDLYAQTHNLGIVAEMLDHAPGSPMTKRYALGAVPSVLRGHMEKFRGRVGRGGA